MEWGWGRGSEERVTRMVRNYMLCLSKYQNVLGHKMQLKIPKTNNICKSVKLNFPRTSSSFLVKMTIQIQTKNTDGKKGTNRSLSLHTEQPQSVTDTDHK